ncbi:MAG TPA: hypothetical protein PLE78_00110 [Flavobacteriales bacterium]|nr:hypothetical protein [Flavobacteriales bacterium]HQV73862.1 hypothetical protein [Flavobacteriales bacterium]HQW41755.1 hypothetical protein [Flavobacteriales bacterium]
MERAPIVIFAYKRPQALQRMLVGLAANDLAGESRVIIFCDGPKANATDHDHRSIAEVRELAKGAAGFAHVDVIEALANKGLAASVIDGVTHACDRFGRTIVVEDDAVVSPHFLRFMNEALDTFAAVERVFSVGSWNYFAPPDDLQGNFFLRYPDSLAWATWKRSWDLFEKDGTKLLTGLKEQGLLDHLDADGEVSYFSEMLKAQIKGHIDSWAIRWTANCILQGKVNYFPQVTMSLNKGFGADATHETTSDHNAELQLAADMIPVEPVEALETPAAIAAWIKYAKYHFEGGHDTSIKALVWRKLPLGLRQWYTRVRKTDQPVPEQLAFDPVSRVFGIDRGKPVDRYYIENFLGDSRSEITGHVMEIEDPTYTQQFGGPGVRSEVLRFKGSAGAGIRLGDLTAHESLPDAELDAFICTQTLNFIYDHQLAVRGLYKSLKPGGVALVSVAGLVQISRYDAERWGDYWRFTPNSALRMFEDVFGKGNVEVTCFGNSYAATCLIKGFATEECDRRLLDSVDADYPVVIGIKARRK